MRGGHVIASDPGLLEDPVTAGDPGERGNLRAFTEFYRNYWNFGFLEFIWILTFGIRLFEAFFYLQSLFSCSNNLVTVITDSLVTDN